MKSIRIMVAMLMAALMAIALSGCSSRTYSYRSPDGAMVNIAVVGTDAQVGVIDAGRETADGGRVWLHVENMTQTDRAISLAEEALKKIPTLPLPLPIVP